MSSPSRRFLVLHGWQNRRPPDHWQWWLTDRLRDAGEQVLYPQLPDPDEPRLDAWLEVLRAELQQLGAGERVVVAHSLSCLLWLHACARGDVLDRPVDRVLLVAPPGPALFADGTLPATFTPPRLAPEAVAGAARQPTRLVASDDDPYCPEGAAAAYGRPLALDVEVLPGTGHLAREDGYGPWAAVLAWCQDGATRFTSSGAGQRG